MMQQQLDSFESNSDSLSDESTVEEYYPPSYSSPG